ncbi:MAG: mercuric reductase [Phototrophicaceae bacterium]
MRYDAIVIGAGQAGPSLAAFFASEGQNVALVEGGKMGGSCVNYGCTPTKTMRASARVAYQVKRGADYGVITGDVSIDFARVMARKDAVVSASRDGLTSWLESIDTLTIYREYGQFIGTENGIHQVQVGNDRIESERVYLNVGTRAMIPPIDGLADVDSLDNVKLMALTELPDHLVILGGSYIGLEIGQIFRRFGSEVTIIERSPRVAFREDEDISAEIERIMVEEGITILTDYSAKQVQQDGNSVTVTIAKPDGQRMNVSGSHLLVATGRIPNTDTLNLDAIGLDTDKRGYIETNGQLETSIEGIWALGDINRRGAFTHTSYHDYEIVRDNWLGDNRSADDRTMVYSMFTDPPLGRVGMSETEARNSGRNILAMKHLAKDVSRAKEDGELNGMVKLIVDADTEEFLGATTFIMQGDDVVQIVSNYMATGASYKKMQQALPVHPTISEFFPTWLGMLEPLD